MSGSVRLVLSGSESVQDNFICFDNIQKVSLVPGPCRHFVLFFFPSLATFLVHTIQKYKNISLRDFQLSTLCQRSYAILLLQLLGYVALISNEDSSTMEEIFLNPFITVFNSDDSELCLLGWFFTYSAASILMVKLC